MISSEAEQALRSLRDSRAPLAGVESRVPRRPGLYAVYGDAKAWMELGLGDPPDDRPLYVGKAEESLLTRDIRTHFGNGRTGQSTVRRSMAALLRETLNLRGRPRNPAKPGYFSNYGLSPHHDAALTKWMRDQLELGFWPAPGATDLGQVEREVIVLLKPPLNLTYVATEWTQRLKQARKTMADDARTWSP